jgi:hypothetical protein
MLAMMAQGLVQIYWDPLFSGSHDWQELNTYFQITLARTRLQHTLLLHHIAAVLSRVHALLVFQAIGMVHSLSPTLPDARRDLRAGS